MDKLPADAPDLAVLQAAVANELAGLVARPLAPGLYLLATPIGNLGDVSLRALSVMARADVLYCEDTRHSRKLLDRYGLRRRLQAFHEHNEDSEGETVLGLLERQQTVALMSDAGTPLISDPGFKLVRSAQLAGHSVIAIPGASAVLAALTASGLATDCFTFAGFLPTKAGARLERLDELSHVSGTLVFFEAPQRAEAALQALSEKFGSDCPAALCRELTKIHEDIRCGTLGDLLAHARTGALKGELVIVLSPVRSAEIEVSNEDIGAALATFTSGSLRDRVDAVATQLRAPRKRVYDIALRSRKDGGP